MKACRLQTGRFFYLMGSHPLNRSAQKGYYLRVLTPALSNSGGDFMH